MHVLLRTGRSQPTVSVRKSEMRIVSAELPIETEKGQGPMKKVVLSVVAALAVTAAPAFAADMPVKAKPMVPVAVPSPWDIAFGTAFTTDYVLRGITQSNHKPAVQGYFEVDY